MPLVQIKNQRISFEDFDDPCNNQDGSTYCTLLNNLDVLRIQFLNTDCLPRLNCDPSFTAFENVFTIDWDMSLDDQGVTMDNNAHWTYDQGAETLCHTDFGSPEYLKFAFVVAIGYSFQYTINWNNRTVGSWTPDAGGVTGTTYTDASGSVTGSILNCINGDPFEIAVTADWDGCFTYIQIDFIGSCWSADNDSAVFSFGSVCHVPGTASVISQDITTFLLPGYSLAGFVSITISGRTQGSVTIGSDVVTANGTTILQNNIPNPLTITMDADFDGCITNVQEYQLNTNYQFFLTDLEGNEIVNLGSQATATYFDGYANVNMQFDQGSLVDSNDDPIPYGCYKFCYRDPCVQELEVQLIADQGFDTPSDWTIARTAGTGSITVTTSFFELITGNTGTDAGYAIDEPLVAWNSVPTFYYFNIEIRTLDWESTDVNNTISLVLPNTVVTLVTDPLPNTTYFIQVYTDAYDIGGAFDGEIGLAISLHGTAPNEHNQIGYFSCVKIAEYDAGEYDFCSNCISWQEEHECTKYIVGYNNEQYSMGFNFSPGGGTFILDNRVHALIFNSEDDTDEENYLFSTGVRQLIYSRSEEYETMLFNYVDKPTHRNINAIINTDHFLIDSVEYYRRKENYKPDWDKDGRQKTAQSRIDVKIKDNAIFNR